MFVPKSLQENKELSKRRTSFCIWEWYQQNFVHNVRMGWEVTIQSAGRCLCGCTWYFCVFILALFFGVFVLPHIVCKSVLKAEFEQLLCHISWKSSQVCSWCCPDTVSHWSVLIIAFSLPLSHAAAALPTIYSFILYSLGVRCLWVHDLLYTKLGVRLLCY